MKTKRLLGILALVLCSIPLCAQVSTMSKKECKQTMTGTWQIVGQTRDGKQICGPIFKVYSKSGEYLFLTSLGSSNGKLRIQHEGTWNIPKPGVLEENTTYRGDREGGKGEKAVVEFEIIDYNHMTISWKTSDGQKSTEHYTRVVY